ncbi:tetraspanin-6 [Daphnia magna]|uniref:Tetraspanin n=2 Tax=Daphnia magna TaxID=35525 RepID=A0A164I7A9_9CRUS|nr:tetraspanin-6 [Daphnia magna]KAK4025951.1 hypothetical protein OUZ56_014983 [Daphnia magna]KZS00958.1 Tetraspanin-7 [Daphnia magna]
MPARFQSGWTLAFMKILLVVFDFALWVFGCAVLAAGIWMKFEVHKFIDVNPSNPVASHIAIFFMSVGIAIALVGLMSCYCTLSGNPILLYLYSAFLGVVLVVQISIGIAAFAYQDAIKVSFKNGLKNSMKNYRNVEANQDAVDTMQATLKCCGVESYEDWKDYGLPVPNSCCKVQNCNPKNPTMINEVGCYTTVVTFISSSGKLIGIICLAVAGFHILGLILTCMLASCINKWKYETIL